LQCTIPRAISFEPNKGSRAGVRRSAADEATIRIGPRWAAGPACRSLAAPDPKDDPMSDIAATPAKPKAKATPIIPLFELPKFDLPKFDLPKLEVPAAFREIAEKGVAQAKDAYEKVKAATEEATDLIEDTYTTAVKGTVDYNLKVIEAARANANAAFDFASELIGVKSLSEVVELTTAHARKQFEAVTEQTKELTAAAQKLAAETAEPIKAGVTKAFKKVA
jgi:phasin